MISSTKASPKHEPRTETLRIPGSNRKARPAPLQPLRQAPVAPRNGSIRIVPDESSSNVYSTSLLRKPSIETRCSTLKSDILNYYLNSGNSIASATNLTSSEPIPNQPAIVDFGDFSQGPVNVDSTETVHPHVKDGIRASVVHLQDQFTESSDALRERTGFTPTATVAPSEFPADAIAGFDFALNEEEPAIAILYQDGPPPSYLSFESSPPRPLQQDDREAILRDDIPSPPPPAPTPTYSLFPALTTPPQITAGIILSHRGSSSANHTRNASSSSSSLYAPSAEIISPLPSTFSSLPRRPRVARQRSATLSSTPSTPSTSSTSTIRPSFSSHKRDLTSSSRWSNDTASRPLRSPSSRTVSFATSALPSSLDRQSGTVSTTSTSPTTSTPHGSVTTSYISSKKRLSRPLLTPSTFDSVPISVFDDDESEDDVKRWKWRGRSWSSFGSREVRGGELRLLSSNEQQGAEPRRRRRGWTCCGL
ncbi:Hypothetical protein D9617_7g029220 [Elsinoe fawcettii]|nr:Hypothetical protein D9617_7g029220 [Elsinoe fawcettii]